MNYLTKKRSLKNKDDELMFFTILLYVSAFYVFVVASYV